jgi:hypothetical protein
MTLRALLRLLGVNLDRKLAQLHGRFDELKRSAISQATERVKETGLTVVGFILASDRINLIRRIYFLRSLPNTSSDWKHNDQLMVGIRRQPKCVRRLVSSKVFIGHYQTVAASTRRRCNDRTTAASRFAVNQIGDTPPNLVKAIGPVRRRGSAQAALWSAKKLSGGSASSGVNRGSKRNRVPQ